MGIGADAAGVVDMLVVVVEIVFVSSVRSEPERRPYMLAVIAAPAPALAAAMIAMVVFDILKRRRRLPLGAAFGCKGFI
jgi:hypothetical protein